MTAGPWPPGHMRMTLRIIQRISRLHFEEDRIGGRHLLNMPGVCFFWWGFLCVVHSHYTTVTWSKQA